ncbi:MAG TPA: GAP family protein [Solirubrobacterales bacterium]
MLNVLVLAVGAAVSPTILAVVIVVLHRPQPRRLLAAYLVGGLLTSIAVGIAIVTSLSELEIVSGSSPAADPVVNFTIGFLSLLVAYVLATDRDAGFSERRREKNAAKPQRDPWSERVLSRGSAPIAFAVGVALNLPGAFYLVALKDIAQGESGLSSQVVAIVVFNLIMFVLAEVPLLGYSFAPEATQTRVEQLNDWMARNARQIVIVIATTFGLYLVGRGIVGVV